MIGAIGTAHGKRFLLIAASGTELGGIRNSGTVLTLDSMNGGKWPFAEVDFVSFLRADGPASLREKMREAGLEFIEFIEPTAGVIEKPTGGDN